MMDYCKEFVENSTGGGGLTSYKINFIDDIFCNILLMLFSARMVVRI